MSEMPPQLALLLDNIRRVVEPELRDGRAVEAVRVSVDASGFLLAYGDYADNWALRPPDGYLTLRMGEMAARLPVVVSDGVYGGTVLVTLGEYRDPVWSDV